MNLLITDNHMYSDHTRHTAVRTEHGWRLSWLPGRLLDRNQAITGMTITETVARSDLFCDDPMWAHIDAWAAELGLSGPDAVVRASQPPSQKGDQR